MQRKTPGVKKKGVNVWIKKSRNGGYGHRWLHRLEKVEGTVQHNRWYERRKRERGVPIMNGHDEKGLDPRGIGLNAVVLFSYKQLRVRKR